MDKKEFIFELRKQRKTYAEIAFIMGISKQRVHQLFTGYKSLKPDIKEEIKFRDDDKCTICDSKENLEVHHIKGRKIENPNDTSNLVTLCKNCHLRVEKEDRKTWKGMEIKFINVKKDTKMIKKHEKIIKLWETTKEVHPSYGEVAKEIGCSKSLVVKVVKNYLKNKNSTTGQN